MKLLFILLLLSVGCSEVTRENPPEASISIVEDKRTDADGGYMILKDCKTGKQYLCVCRGSHGTAIIQLER